MGSNPIRIGVEADLGGLTAFESGVASAGNAAQKLAQAFAATGLTGKQLADQVIEASRSMVAAQPAIIAQGAEVLNLKTALQSVTGALKETESMVVEAGGATGATTSVIKQYSAEQQAQIAIQQRLSEATAQYRTALQATSAAVEQAAAAAAAQASAQRAGLETTEAQAAATQQDATAQEEYVAAIEQAAAADAEKVSAATAEAEATQMQAAAAEDYATAMEAAIAAQESQTAVTANAATAQEAQAAASGEQATAANAAAGSIKAATVAAAEDVEANDSLAAAYRRVSIATIEKERAKKALTQTTRDSVAAEGAEDISSNELAAAMQRADVATAELNAAQKALDAQLGKTASGMYSFGGAVAYTDTRVAAFLAHLGPLGYALGRVAIAAGAASATLATVFQFAFPILIGAALIGPLEQLFGWLTKNEEAAGKLQMKMDDLTASAADTANSIELENLKLQDQLDKLLEIPSHNAVQEAILEDEKAVDGLSEKFETLLDKEQKAFDPSTAQQFAYWIATIGLALGTNIPSDIATKMLGTTAREQLEGFQKQLLNAQERITAIRESMDQGVTSQKTGLAEELGIWESIQKQALDLTKSTNLNASQQNSLNSELRIAAEEIRSINEQEKNLGLRSQVNRLKAEADARKEVEERMRKEGEEDTVLFERYEKEKREAVEYATAQIKANEDVAASVLKVQEVQSRAAFTRADTPAALQAAAIPLIKETTDAYNNQIDALKKQVTVLNQYQPENYLTKIAELAAQETVLENEKSAALLTIDNEYNTRKRQIEQQSLNDQIEELNSEVSRVKEAAAAKQVVIQEALQKKPQRFAPFAVTTGIDEAQLVKEVAMKTAAAREEYEAARSYLDQEITDTQIALDQKVITQAEATKKIIEISKQEGREKEAMLKKELEARKDAAKKEQQEIDNAAKKMADSFTGAANEILRGQTTISQGFAKLAANIELEIIDKAINKIIVAFSTKLLTSIAQSEARQTAIHTTAVAQREVVDTTAQTKNLAQLRLKVTQDQIMEAQQTAQHAVQQTAQATATATSQAAQTASATAGSSTRDTVGIAEDIKSIGRAASTAAAHAFKWVMEDVPFPANIALAPAAAAGAFTAVMAYEALGFEKGGVVPGRSDQAVPIVAHGQEMVLPGEMSNFIQGAVRTSQAFANSTAVSSPTQSVSHTNHVRNEFNLYHNGPDARQILETELVPRINRAMRNGMLGGGR